MEGQPGHPEAFYGEYVSGCGDTTNTSTPQLSFAAMMIFVDLHTGK
jgi:hypothetical protein